MDKLNRHIKDKLPLHIANESLWFNIDNKLGSTQKLSNRLPVHKVNPELWLKIEPELRHKTIRWYTVTGIAATLMAAIFAITMLLKTNKDFDNYQVENGVIREIHNNTQQDKAGQQFEHYCQSFPSVCETNKYTTLKNQLDQLIQQRANLLEMQNYDSDPDIALYIARINKEVSSIELKLLALF